MLSNPLITGDLEADRARISTPCAPIAHYPIAECDTRRDSHQIGHCIGTT